MRLLIVGVLVQVQFGEFWKNDGVVYRNGLLNHRILLECTVGSNPTFSVWLIWRNGRREGFKIPFLMGMVVQVH